jgi:hypothetical protein
MIRGIVMVMVQMTGVMVTMVMEMEMPMATVAMKMMSVKMKTAMTTMKEVLGERISFDSNVGFHNSPLGASKERPGHHQRA